MDKRILFDSIKLSINCTRADMNILENQINNNIEDNILGENLLLASLSCFITASQLFDSGKQLINLKITDYLYQPLIDFDKKLKDMQDLDLKILDQIHLKQMMRQSMENEEKNSKEFTFTRTDGYVCIIKQRINSTIEDLINHYKNQIPSYVIKDKELFFVYNGEKIETNDQRTIEDAFQSNKINIVVIYV